MDGEVKELISQMTDLIKRSEERVDRTNSIISKAFNILDKITTEYTLQINKLQEARDMLLEQNAKLIGELEKRDANLLVAEKRYDSLVDKFFNNIKYNKSENNINVK